MNRISERKIILIYRDTRLDELIRRYNTREQVRFYLESRGQSFAEYDEEDRKMKSVIREISRALTVLGRVQLLERSFLPNFLFGPDDIPLVVGQDGLVANVLKYLRGQPLVAVNPLPDVFDGILLPFLPGDVSAVIRSLIASNEMAIKNVSLARADFNDGQSMLAVNDFYIGPKLPVSVRYCIELDGRRENQSSSGVIVSTGLGSTGWMSSLITGAEGISGKEVGPISGDWAAQELMFGVREPFRSATTSTHMVYGRIQPGKQLELSSYVPEGGVVFSDGIVSDAIDFNAGTHVIIRLAEQQGYLVS
jgi:NAD kinase